MLLSVAAHVYANTTKDSSRPGSPQRQRSEAERCNRNDENVERHSHLVKRELLVDVQARRGLQPPVDACPHHGPLGGPGAGLHSLLVEARQLSLSVRQKTRAGEAPYTHHIIQLNHERIYRMLREESEERECARKACGEGAGFARSGLIVEGQKNCTSKYVSAAVRLGKRAKPKSLCDRPPARGMAVAVAIRRGEAWPRMVSR